jgi:NAD(P)-dependent dehydrogenase (short-subunit alcohol dehydrogenase family)
MKRDIKERVVAITGAARGIGHAIAKRLVQAGARVALGDLDGELAAKEAHALGGGAIGGTVDVGDAVSFASFLDEVETKLGQLDVLVNNAGIMVLGAFDEEDDTVTRRTIDVNLIGVMHGCRLAMRRMKPRGHGHIINIASTAGKVGVPHGATYCATKHAVVGLSESLRYELRGTGVEMSCVMPAVVTDTELAAGLPATRGLDIEADDVADAVASALEKPRFDVFVPKMIGGLLVATSLLPRATRERIGRALGGERVFMDVDEKRRASYMKRVTGEMPVSDTRRRRSR